MKLSVSIVLFRTPACHLERCVSSLVCSVRAAIDSGMRLDVDLCLVVNDEMRDVYARACLAGDLSPIHLRWLAGHGNVGFGRGHNLAFSSEDSDFVLILNPDAFLAEDAILNALGYMEMHPDVGLLAPKVVDESGGQQYLCRAYPSVYVLLGRVVGIGRGLLPFAERENRRYELWDVMDRVTLDREVLLVSGCCMLFRGPLLRALGGFDPSFFMYFEDYDLSLRASRKMKNVYHAGFRVCHLGGDASRKGWRHIAMFISSAWRFFNKHGWRWWSVGTVTT